MSDFAVIVEEARAGCPTALEELREIACNCLKRVQFQQIRPPLKQRFSESDAGQDTFIRVVERIADFRGTTEAELFAWVKRIATNVVHDAVRREQAQGRDVRAQVPADQPLPGDKSTPSAAVERAEQKGRVLAAIRGLPDPQRDAIRLMYFEHRSIAEIAEQMGRTEAAVGGLIKRAYATLRKHGVRLR